MGLFDIDYDSLLPQLLPVRLRQLKMIRWLKALIDPVKYLNNLFQGNRTNNLYMLAHNSQVCYLQAALNDTFDNIGRGIYITDGAYVDPAFIYLEDEVKPLWLWLISEEGATPFNDPVPLFSDIEVYALTVAFIVHVPIAVVYDASRMSALIDRYRLVSRNNYSIVTY